MRNNLDLLLASLAFLTVVVYHFLSQKTMKLENNRSFFHMLIMGFFNLFFGMLGIIMVWLDQPELDGLTESALQLTFLMEVLTAHATLLHIVTRCHPSPKDRYWLVFPLLIAPAFMTVQIFCNYFTRNLLTVENGVYQLGVGYFTMLRYMLLILLSMAFCGIRFRKNLGRQKTRALWEVVVLISVSLIYRVVNRDEHSEMLSGFTGSLAIMVVFLTINNPYRCIDSLTGAYDLTFFRQRAEHLFARQRKFHILTVNVNQLEHINYVLGAEIGSDLLKKIAQMLSSGSKKNMVFRISGRRFLVICPTVDQLNKVRFQAEKFFTSSITLHEECFEPHAVVCLIPNAQKLETSGNILSYCRYLARQAKWPFETCMVESNEKTLEGFHYRQEVESFMETAMEQDLFHVVFQPVYNMQQKKYTTMEVLSRLNHPTLGPVSPEIFIDIAEKNDQIARIALLQLRRVCEFLVQNPQIQTNFQNIKVNVSPVELLKPGHMERMLDMIREYGIPLNFFQFEITESTAIEHDAELDKIVQKFTDAGIGLCLDDFGSGYANLNAVVKLPFHTIKLDRSLLFGICQDQKVAGLYQSLVVSLHNMGFVVLAEGVETDQELELVSKWGVDMIQGFYFSRPLTGPVLMENILKAC